MGAEHTQNGRDRTASPRLEWFNTIEPGDEDWLIDGVLPDTGFAAIYGPSGSGKSLLALDWALRLAAGLSVFGLATERVGVAYIGIEGAAGLRKRIKAWRIDHAIDEPLPFAFIANASDLRSIERPDVQALINALNDAHHDFDAAGATLRVIIIDTLAAATAGITENSSEGMGGAVAALNHIAHATGALIVVIHHSGKNEDKGLRGHTSLPAALNATIEVSFDDQTKTHIVKLQKQRDGESHRDLGAFQLRQLEVGVNGKKKPITSVVIDYVDAPDRQETPKMRENRKKPLAPKAEILLRAVHQLLSEGHGETPPPNVQCLSGLAISVDDARERAQSIGFGDTGEGIRDPAQRRRVMNASRMAFARAKERLIADRRLYEREGWLWPA